MRLARENDQLVFRCPGRSRVKVEAHHTDSGYDLLFRGKGGYRSLEACIGEIVPGPDLIASATTDEVDVIEGRREIAETIRTRHGDPVPEVRTQ